MAQPYYSSENKKFPWLHYIAKSSLERNIVNIKSGRYLMAGEKQFSSLWTRDFCFAAKGLLFSGNADVVKSQLNKLIKSKRKQDSLIPRTLDSISAQIRVFVTTTSAGRIPMQLISPLRDPLRPEYTDQYGSAAIDSNILFLYAALSYVKFTNDYKWWYDNQKALKEIYDFYIPKMKNGFIEQDKFSDWQDSANRSGFTFYTNLLYYIVSKDLEQFSYFGINPNENKLFRQKLIDTFYDENVGIFNGVIGIKLYSLEGNLIAIENNLFEDEEKTRELYLSLKKHNLWSYKVDLPGIATYPNYPSNWVSPFLKFVGLRNYHGAIYWSWLIAYSAKISYLMNDKNEGQRILNKLQEIALRDGVIYEIYRQNDNLTVWNSFLYKSEGPFSWGSGVTIEALHTAELAD
ncbi:MAG: hypothetical protein U0T83_04830 [Bacteriovoracaceae bacterium]